MRMRIPYALAVAALLLVGAGCGASVSENANVETQKGTNEAPKMEQKSENGEIDASVDGMLKSSDDEKAEQADAEKDAGEVDADKTDINAFGEASYELSK